MHAQPPAMVGSGAKIGALGLAWTFTAPCSASTERSFGAFASLKRVSRHRPAVG